MKVSLCCELQISNVCLRAKCRVHVWITALYQRIVQRCQVDVLVQLPGHQSEGDSGDAEADSIQIGKYWKAEDGRACLSVR